MPEETKKEEPKKQPASTPGDPKDVQENKAITFLSYLGILCLIPLLAKKDSKFAQFHSKQGLVLFIAWFVISWIGGFIPFLGWFLIVPAISIVGIVLAIMGLINVANGEMKDLPIVADLAKKINL